MAGVMDALLASIGIFLIGNDPMVLLICCTITLEVWISSYSWNSF
jgi:hypothetical protein